MSTVTADGSRQSGVEYILAPDSEHAAWQALELSTDRDAQLIDVRLTPNYDW